MYKLETSTKYTKDRKKFKNLKSLMFATEKSYY